MYSKRNAERTPLNKEEIGRRKPQLENNHLNKPVYRSKRERRKKKNYFKSNDKHKEQQKDKHEDVKKDFKIIKCEERK